MNESLRKIGRAGSLPALVALAAAFLAMTAALPWLSSIQVNAHAIWLLGWIEQTFSQDVALGAIAALSLGIFLVLRTHRRSPSLLVRDGFALMALGILYYATPTLIIRGQDSTEAASLARIPTAQDAPLGALVWTIPGIAVLVFAWAVKKEKHWRHRKHVDKTVGTVQHRLARDFRT